MRKRISERLASTCLLLLWIAMPLLSVAHVALEQHSYCAQHERLEESSQAHRIDVDARSPRGERSAKLSTSAPSEPEGPHEGCAFGEDFRRESPTLLNASQSATPALLSASSPVLREHLAAVPLPLLRIAPKGSPPGFA